MADVVNNFSVPTETSNVVLVVDGKKLHVNKDFLAVHSPVFKAMFFGQFKENGQDEVEIKDVVYEEFVDLLNVIYPGFFKITAASVSHILKLADQYQIKEARDQADLFLSKTKTMDLMARLDLANKYNLKSAMVSGLMHFKCVYHLPKLQSSGAYASYSDAMKAAISDRMMQLFGQSGRTFHGSSECTCNN